MKTVNVHEQDYKGMDEIQEEWLYSLPGMKSADVIHVLQKSFDMSRKNKDNRVKGIVAEAFQLYDVFSTDVIPYIELTDLYQYTDKGSVRDWVMKMVSDGAVPRNVKVSELAEEVLNRLRQYRFRKLSKDVKNEIKQRLRSGANVDELAHEYFLHRHRVVAFKAVVTRQENP